MSESIPEKKEGIQITSTEILCIICKRRFYTTQKHECGIKDNERIIRIR